MSKDPNGLKLPRACTPTAPVKKADVQTVRAEIIPSIVKAANCDVRGTISCQTRQFLSHKLQCMTQSSALNAETNLDGRGCPG